MAHIRLDDKEIELSVGELRIGTDDDAHVRVDGGAEQGNLAIIAVDPRGTATVRRAMAGATVLVNGVALGAEPEKDKLSAGDRRTPTGLFYIQSRNANSEYHLALRIAFPDSAHRARAAALGLAPGGDIEIHGLQNGRGATGAFHRTADWTNGCIALTDEEIEEIWTSVPVGTPVEIRP